MKGGIGEVLRGIERRRIGAEEKEEVGQARSDKNFPLVIY